MGEPLEPLGFCGSDYPLLEDLERSSFDFFWTEADPHTGLVRDRAFADGGDTRKLSSIAATGFGLTGLCIGHQRRYRAPEEIKARVSQDAQVPRP